MSTIRCLVGITLIAGSGWALGCVASAESRAGADDQGAEQIGDTEQAGAPLRIGRGCFHDCFVSCSSDPYCPENCRCVCYGRPGRTCWLQ